jgi:hypothetical protein
VFAKGVDSDMVSSSCSNPREVELAGNGNTHHMIVAFFVRSVMFSLYTLVPRNFKSPYPTRS